MYRLMLGLYFLLVAFTSGAQQYYTTTFGQTVVILEDFSYELAPTDLVSKEGISPFEMPTNDAVLIADEELNEIYNLEASANTREIDSYIAILKLEASKGTLDITDELEEQQAALAAAQMISEHIQRLRTEKSDARKKRYEKIQEMIMELDGNSITIPIKKVRPKTQKQLIPDLRQPHEISTIDDCTIIYNDYDEQLKVDRKETKALYLFGYTHPRLQRHFTGKDYINTKASLAKIDGDYYLILEIDIASKSASKNYGALLPKEKSRLRFVDGSTIYIQPINEQKGKLQNYTGHTIYNPIYKLDKSDIKQLEKTEVDDIGIMWTSGFENYEVYHVDALQKLATCIRK